MAIQRHKIVYGEDISAIHEQRKESWAQLALAAGYRSAITVPLLLQIRLLARLSSIVTRSILFAVGILFC